MRIIRKPEVERKTGLSIMQISRKEKAREFPARVQLGPNAVGWIEAEVDAWLEERAAGRGPLPQRVRNAKQRRAAGAGAAEAVS